MIRPNLGRGVRKATMLALAMLPTLVHARSVSLSEAWNRVREASPVLAAAVSGVRSAEAGLEQARLLPNPELELMTEEYGRSEVEVALTLPLEIGGQRWARVRAARAALDIAQLDEVMTRLQLRAETLRRLGSALALKQKIELSDTLLGLVRSSTADIARRVNAGAAMELDLVREQTELVSLQVEARGLERSYRAACRALAALWADTSDLDWEPVGFFIGRPELPDREVVLAKILGCPEVLCCSKAVEAARAELAGARAKGFPEVALTGGYLRNNEAREGAVRLGASMSLPIFNRNQGAIRAARHALAGAEHAAVQARLAREVKADLVLAELAGLFEVVDTGHAVILPAQRRVLSTLTRHYELGAIGILELIEVQREFHETSMDLIDAQGEWTSLAADLLEATSYELAVIKE